MSEAKATVKDLVALPDKIDSKKARYNWIGYNQAIEEISALPVAEVGVEDIAVTIKEWSKIDKDMPYILWDGYFKPIANAVHKKYRSVKREATP